MAEEKPKRTEQAAPYPLAMIVCDAIVKDPSTQKATLFGCFSAIAARAFPAVQPIFCVYAVMTDGHGKMPLKLRLVDADEARAPIFEVDGEANFNEPRSVLEVSFLIQNVVFPEPGEYRLQLYAAGQHMIERRIVLIGPPEAPAGGENG